MQTHATTLALSDGSRDHGMPESRPEILAARREIRRGLTTDALRDAVEDVVVDRILDGLARDLRRGTGARSPAPVKLQERESDVETPEIRVRGGHRPAPLWINPAWQPA